MTAPIGTIQGLSIRESNPKATLAVWLLGATLAFAVVLPMVRNEVALTPTARYAIMVAVVIALGWAMSATRRRTQVGVESGTLMWRRGRELGGVPLTDLSRLQVTRGERHQGNSRYFQIEFRSHEGQVAATFAPSTEGELNALLAIVSEAGQVTQVPSGPDTPAEVSLFDYRAHGSL